MGNLAVKCDMRWQERKVVTSCVGRGTVDVRVMKADGSEVEEFDRPVVAAEVMYQFPDYVVVQWCPRRNTKLGKRGQLRVLQRYEVLTPGQIYILFPIPVEVVKNINATARRSRRMQSTKDRLSLLLQRSGMGTSTSSTTTTTDTALQEQEQSIRCDERSTDDERSEAVEETQPPSFGGFRPGAWQPKLSADDIPEEIETSGNEEGTSSRIPNLYLSPFFAGRNWRPALLSIPESPGSPKTPIAFRLISTRSCRESDQPI